MTALSESLSPGLDVLFEERARCAPESVALTFGEEEVRYGELDRRAEALAARLRGLGVGPEVLVGLCLERSVEMVVGLLGVLKAGGAYLPLDPDYPEDRLRFMWEDSRAIAPPGAPSVVLSQSRLAERLGWLGECGGRLVLLDGAEPGGAEAESAGRRPAAPGSRRSSRHLAYVIYTSGSTGRPKGVMVAHRGVVNVVRHAAEALDVGSGSRVLQLASLSFDASVLEIFTALGHGAHLVLTPRETLLSGEELGAELRGRGIHTLAIPPSLLDKVPDGVELPELRSIVVGGEACSAATARRWASGRIFVNAFAPTEATIYTTAGLCLPPIDRAPSMGTPIPGTEVRVLDPWGRPVADGEVGELCLGGLGIARGYAGRPGLTADRFVPDPQAGEAGARLYRSGDLGRRLPDGSLEFVGRVDHQVKVRGLRIELGEIEASLVAHPAVRQAVVVRREDVPGDAKLVGYVVLERHREASASDLRAFLAERLPEPMAPSAFVTLNAFPQTATGKIDRRALPAPGPERPDLSTEYAAPEGLMETALADIWGDLLGLDRVGVADDLFELGGHSLVVAQMVNRVRRELGLELPLQAPFEHPTVRALSTFLEGQVASGAGEVREGPSSTDRLPPIERAPRDEPIPLSFPQERIWFVQQLAPSAIAYNFQFSLRMRGTLSIPALERTLAELVRRHEVLRTTFPAVDGRPVQEIHPPFPIEMPVVDLSRVPAEEREERLRGKVLAEVLRGFRVTELPLLRWTLFRLAPDDHLWLQVEHHFVHDGWSLGVYLRELEVLYGAFSRGEPSPLPEPEIQYADFARWQRRFMEGHVLEEQLAFWRAKLAGSPPVLELPTDRPRSRAHGFQGGCLRVDLAPELYRRVRAFGRRQGVTLFMTMLSAFDALLYRYTGQEDLVLGSGLANRRLKETEGLVGMVVNTLVVRSRLAGSMPVTELLEQVRRTTLELHLYQDLPFEKLVEELQPDRDLSRNPLFQVLFSFHDAPVPDLGLPGLSTHLFEWHNGSAKTDLNVVVKPVAEQRVGRQASAADDVLTMVWEYSADLYDRATIERMWGHYQRVLAALVEAPDTLIDRLPLLSERERRELVVEWNDTASDYPRERCIGSLFEEVAVRRPEAVALHQEGRAWSYGELDRRSAALAARLAAEGVGPESLVGIAAERSPELIAGLLGIVRAGAAYLPLDPDYPEERLRFMLEDGGVSVLLVSAAARERLPAFGGAGGDRDARVLDLETAVAGSPVDGAGATGGGGAGPRSLAYVLYTSGSMGKPKGVAVEHRSVVRLVRGADYADLGEDQTFLQLAPVPFDASTLEIWGALLNGGRLEIHPPGTPSLAELGRGIESSRATTLWLTAGLFHQMVESELPRLAGVRQLLAGGDTLSPPHVARVRSALAPGSVLINGYGPTEGTTFTCCHSMGAAPAADDGGPVPIGRPIANTRVHLVRPGAGGGLEPVPAGVPGELFIGGDGVARGYHARAGLTAAAFVPDPFGPAGGRLYRTGDTARWLSDGTVDFIGRIDGQVKLRGFRIELGEVEAALQELPEVAEAAVAVRGTGDGGGSSDRRLVAYAVPREGREVTPDGLRRALEARLPDHMVPNLFLVLDALPLGPTGKVDRKSLPESGDAAGASGSSRHADRIAPRTPTEELVAGIWARVLDVERVGVDDDFFHVGGHSLLATRLLSRVRDATGAEVPLTDLFDAPTVAGLSRAVEARLRGGADDRATDGGPIPRRPDDGPAPLSFAQERLWFLDRLTPGEAAYNVARALRLRGPLDRAALAGALAQVARRHEVLRARFALAEGRPVQVADQPALPLPVVDLHRLHRLGGDRAAAAAEALGRAESRGPFDLARGPLARAVLVRTAPDDHVLLLTFHHAVFDGWSVEIFYRELAETYGGRSAPPPPIQYADYSAWQREHLSGARLEGLLGWWREHLAGAPGALELPADRPRPRMLSARGARAARALPAGLPAAVEALAAARGVTPFMVWASAFAALVHRYTGREDVVLGTPMANRARTEVEGLIGFFASSLVLRIDAGGDPGFGDLVDRTRTAVLGAYAHQEIPFEKLVDELAPERDLSRSPLFQVLFQIEESGADRLELPGLEVTRLDLARAETKFDLSLSLTPGGELPVARVQYSTDLFDGTRMLRLLGHLKRLVEAAVAEPEAPLSRLPLLGPAERLQVLAEWNDSATRLEGADATIPALFARAVEATPDAVAVTFEAASLSYRELHRRATRWAYRLRALGVGPEVLVGLCVERSPEMMVGLLAILEAGGAYVPLDPSYPAERLAFMLDDSDVDVVLTLERLRPVLERLGPAGESVAVERERTVLCLDGDEPDVGGSLGPVRLGPDHLAYAIYTSGSTGRPKGAMNAHRAVVNRLLWMRDEYGIGPEDRILQKTPVSFDVSVWELFLPLLAGARLVIARPEGHRDPSYLAETVRREGITTLHFVPSMLEAFVGQPGVEACRSLRRVIASGEALSPALVGAFGRRVGRPLHNLYGPTEAAVDVTAWPCPAGGGEPRVVPIGRPIADARVRVVDPHLRPAPVGVPGELVLGGLPPCRGYLRRPALTAERFVPDPSFPPASPRSPSHPQNQPRALPGEGEGTPPPDPLPAGWGARLYRTGDLCRTSPTGEIEYLGRLDFQVKIRGHRIETGEIEAALRAHPAVREAVVVARSGAGDHLWLAAFVTAAEGADPAPAELREHLLRALPEPMVPAAVAVLDELPLTPSGKADRGALARRALPAPGGARRGGEDDPESGPPIAPRNALERDLARLWTEVLEIEAIDTIGVHDDFFALGGNSITGAIAINRLQELLGETVSVVALFDAPTVAGLAGHLAAEHREAVARVWGDGAGADPGATEGPRTPSLERLPRPAGDDPATFAPSFAPSFAQERLWFLDRLEPDGAFYNVPVAARVTGDLRKPLLARALDELVRRHETLHTTLPELAGAPVQRIAPAAPVPAPVIDLSRLPPEPRSNEAARLAAAEGELTFDLARGPLFRVRILDLGGAPREHRLLLTTHHTISDGWSLGVLLRDLAALYEAPFEGPIEVPSEGRAPELPELPIQYADFAAWQRRLLTGDLLERQLAYWRERLAGAPALLELPTDRPRPSDQSFRGGRLPFRVGPAVAEGLAVLARASGSTLFMVLLAAYAALLVRHSGQRDVVVGSPIAGRTRREVEELIGFFVNTLALRLDLSALGEDPTFEEIVAAARESALGAFGHQELPFERLVQEVAPERSLAHAPVFQAMLVLQNAPSGPRRMADLELEALEPATRTAKFDLVLSLAETPEGSKGSFQYNADLFDATTVRRFARRFHRLLEAVAAPESRRLPLSALPLMAAAERHQALVEWNDPGDAAGAPGAAGGTLAERFAARAAASPDAIALVWRDRSLSYRELARRARELAAELRRRGAGPEARVAVRRARTPDLVVTLLAVLESGAAYLPLDPAHPPERRELMLRDAGAALVVTDDGVEEGPAAAPSAMPAGSAGMGNLAYVLFTSGSTGRPKAVAVEHRSAVALLDWAREVFPPEDLRALLASTTVSFDLSVFEIFLTLTEGGTLVLAEDALELARLPGASRVTLVNTVPSILAELLRDGGLPASVRTVSLCGEALRRSLAREVGATGAGRLINLYGPSEDTTYSTWARIAPGGDGEPAIGRPIRGTRAYVVGPDLRPVPPGVVGEITLTGAGLARGYLGRPRETAQCFLPDPFGDRLGARLYRTGDLARHRPDGELLFLGRTDHQVKLRGFRIELGEIEAALRDLPEVAEAVVLARGDGAGTGDDRRLVAYVVPADPEAAEVPGLAPALAARLPEYMVPRTVVTLAALPTLPNGKVDRSAFPAPEVGEGAGAALDEPPATPVEELLAGIWREVLEIERVGRRDDFFLLGGHSLLATRVVSHLRAEIGLELPLRTLFRHSRLRDLGAAVEDLLLAEEGTAAD